MAESPQMMSRKRIRQCLFFVELSAAIGISAFTLVLLKVLHCGSWALRLSSTFALLWIIKAAAKFFFSSETQGDDNINENLMNNNSSHDPLKVFEARERNKSIHSKQKNDEDENNSSPPKEQQSTIMMQTKQFLEEEAEGHDDTAKISFSLMSIIATVFFQLVIRLIVVTQNFRFAFRRKKMAASGNGLKSLLFNTPFTIGRSLSPSRCSFYIFSFLNNFLDSLEIRFTSSRINKRDSVVICPARNHPSMEELSVVRISSKFAIFSYTTFCAPI